MEEFNVDYGETPASLKIHCNTASIESLIVMANDIYRDAYMSGVPINNHEACDDLLSRIKAKYKDFTHSFPLIIKWIVLTRQYHPEAFRKYLHMYSSININTREEFLTIQVEYLVYLYRELSPGVNCDVMRKNMLSSVLAEDREFVEKHKNTPATVIKS
jgi:hypothetical protein